MRYEQGELSAFSFGLDGFGANLGATFGSQTPNLPPSVSRPTSPEKPNTGLSAPFGGVSNENPEIKTRGSYVLPDKKNGKWGVLLLTEKELLKMPKKYRPDFRVGRIVAHVRQKNNGVYEIRCQIKKHKIEVSSKLLEVAKEKFIDALRAFEAGSLGAGGSRSGTPELSPVPAPVVAPLPPVSVPAVTLGEYMLKWLETVKKPNVKANTYKEYLRTFTADISPVLGGLPLSGVSAFTLQEHINSYAAEGKFRTAKKIYQLLLPLFDYAVADDVLSKSPMCKVVAPRYEQERGVPLTRSEERAFVDALKNGGGVFLQAFVFLLYTGLRRSELASAELRDGWVHVVTSKQVKGRAAKTRAVPVSPMLAQILPLIDIPAIKALPVAALTREFKAFCPAHHLHDTRHTFITRCQECSIQRELVSLWAGHAADSSTTSLVYTHLQQNRDHQLAEIKKFSYDL